MVNNCLVTKLKKVVDNNMLPFLNEIAVSGSLTDSEETTAINMIAEGAENSAKIRFVNCYLNSTYVPGASTGQSEVELHSVNGYVTPGDNVMMFVSPKDNIRIFQMGFDTNMDIISELKWSGSKLREIKCKQVNNFNISELTIFPNLRSINISYRDVLDGSFNDFGVNYTEIIINGNTRVTGSIDACLNMPVLERLYIMGTPSLEKKRSTITALQNRGVVVMFTPEEVDEEN
jgi:hypothetical protein